MVSNSKVGEERTYHTKPHHTTHHRITGLATGLGADSPGGTGDWHLSISLRTGSRPNELDSGRLNQRENKRPRLAGALAYQSPHSNCITGKAMWRR